MQKNKKEKKIKELLGLVKIVSKADENLLNTILLKAKETKQEVSFWDNIISFFDFTFFKPIVVKATCLILFGISGFFVSYLSPDLLNDDKQDQIEISYIVWGESIENSL